MRKFKWSKAGLQENPVGYHVTLPYQGRELLGEVLSMYRNFVTGNTHLKVRYFCGDMWPIEPLVIVVNVLDGDNV